LQLLDLVMHRVLRYHEGRRDKRRAERHVPLGPFLAAGAQTEKRRKQAEFHQATQSRRYNAIHIHAASFAEKVTSPECACLTFAHSESNHNYTHLHPIIAP
jgi:hypothetical protein